MNVVNAVNSNASPLLITAKIKCFTELHLFLRDEGASNSFRAIIADPSTTLLTSIEFNIKYLDCFLIIAQSNMSELTHILSPDKEIKILKWVVHEGSQISSGSIICLFVEMQDDAKQQRLKNSSCGTVKKLLHKEGDTVAKK